MYILFCYCFFLYFSSLIVPFYFFLSLPTSLPSLCTTLSLFSSFFLSLPSFYIPPSSAMSHLRLESPSLFSSSCCPFDIVLFLFSSSFFPPYPFHVPNLCPCFFSGCFSVFLFSICLPFFVSIFPSLSVFLLFYNRSFESSIISKNFALV